ncbi:nucleoside transporter [Ostertagia ostertagi]
MSALGIASQIPNFLMALINVAQVIGGTLMIRITGTLTINCINVGVIIALVILQNPSQEDMAWFYYVSLTIVIIMNASNGLYQNSVFGLTADFPAAYTNAIVVGNNICGTFISVLSIVTTIGEIYPGITVFLNFNLLAAIGSTTANFVQIPGPNLLLVPVTARLLFIPYFMLCNYNVDDRVMPVFFENEWFFIIGNAVMAFTSGYFSSLAMMYAPRVVKSSLSKTAGMMAALFLVTGERYL